MRTNTQALINTNLETEKNIRGSVLPVIERLHKEIKHKAKELAHGAQKGAKEVEKARNTTQKQIELLGQYTASYESTGHKSHASDDPYVIRRGVLYRLHKQVLEENNHRNDLIAVQTNFQVFEAHIIRVIQEAMEAFNTFAGGQAEKVRALYSDMLGAAQRVPPDFEWKAFMARSGDALVDPNEEPRSVEAIQFPNMDHPSTKPLIEGTLERKSRNKLSFGTQTGYYVVTPSKFLHEFKDSDNYRKEPTPELSIYLPDATIGVPNGEKFSIKGKDRSGTMGSKLAGTSEFNFKAHTAAEAQKWFEAVRLATGTTSPAPVTSPTPSPPAAVDDSKKLEAAPAAAAATSEKPAVAVATDHKGQEAGVTGGETTASPTVISPASTAAATEAKPVAAAEAAPATTTAAPPTTTAPAAEEKAPLPN
ncbi:PH domain-containing protein [Echria macrotheca]|uniref:PH domain-containing protein n=1 Tax=Echria macrotheca TaxID=438768 RepID=A0AAJ0BK92_9PEZI|nr:PH domain-containing protein [Echria macrotheca]